MSNRDGESWRGFLFQETIKRRETKMKAFGIEDCELTNEDFEEYWDIEFDSELAAISLKALREKQAENTM